MADIRKNLKNIFKKNVILNEGKIEEDGWADAASAIKKGYDKGRNIVKNPVKHLITNPIKNTFKNFAKNLLDPKKKKVAGHGHTAHHPVSSLPASSSNTNTPSPHVGGSALPNIPSNSTPTTTIQPTNKPAPPAPVNKQTATPSPVAPSPSPLPSNNTSPVPANPSPEPSKTPTDVNKSTGDVKPPSEEERLKNRWEAIDALVPWRTRTKDQYEHPHPAEIKYKNDPGFQSDLADIEKRWGKGPEATPQDLATKPATNPYSRPASVSDIDDPTKTIQPTNINKQDEPETDNDNFWTNHDASRFDRVFSAADVVLNPKGVELQGIEDPKQKEKKILSPIKQLLINKNKGNKKTLAALKRKYNITSDDPITEISEKDPNDKARKVVIKGIFANGFYRNCYENLLENLRKMNIISEGKLDYGVFKQCAILAVNKAKQQYERRYSLTLKKVKNLDANEKQAESGAKNASKLFLNDIKEIYDNNRNNFAMSRLEENIKFSQYFTEAHKVAPDTMIITEAEVKDAGDAAKKEDDIIRINDYVWWVDQNEMSNIVHDPNKRAQLQFEGKKIQFVPDANGKMFNGTAAVIQLPNGEKQQVDIRNLDVPQNIAKTLIKFGKVIGSENNQLGQTINDMKIKLAQNEKTLRDMTAGNNPDAYIALSDKIKSQKEFLKDHKDVDAENTLHGKAKIQLFVAKDLNNLEKTLAAGGTKITPDQSNPNSVSIDTRELTKMNKKGKMSLLKLIEKHFIAIGLLVGIAGLSIDLLLKGVKALGDKNITGSHHETNF